MSRPGILKCAVCGGPIIWARTMASESGRGGKAMPLDPEPNPEGNVAARVTSRTPYGLGRVCRVLAKDEQHDHQTEQLYMPHFATCPGSGRNIAAAFETFLAEQAGA
jgi:hypothetical protein